MSETFFCRDNSTRSSWDSWKMELPFVVEAAGPAVVVCYKEGMDRQVECGGGFAVAQQVGCKELHAAGARRRPPAPIFDRSPIVNNPTVLLPCRGKIGTRAKIAQNRRISSAATTKRLLVLWLESEIGSAGKRTEFFSQSPPANAFWR